MTPTIYFVIAEPSGCHSERNWGPQRVPVLHALGWWSEEPLLVLGLNEEGFFVVRRITALRTQKAIAADSSE